MDDTALNPQQQVQPVQPVPSTSSGQGVPQATPAQPAAPQQPVSPVAPTPVTGGRPEAPVPSGLPPREAAPIAAADEPSAAADDQAAQPDAVSDAADIQPKETVDVQVQESHPQVEVARELQEAGVEKGEDAEREQLPEEQLAKVDQAKEPDTQATASGISLTSTPVQLEEVKKKNGIRSAIRWLAVSLIRQLKKMQLKPEEQKSTW